MVTNVSQVIINKSSKSSGNNEKEKGTRVINTIIKYSEGLVVKEFNDLYDKR